MAYHLHYCSCSIYNAKQKQPGAVKKGRGQANLSRIIDTIPYDTGLEAPFAHSLHTVYFRKFTPCLLPRLTFEPEPLRQVGKFRPTKLN